MLFVHLALASEPPVDFDVHILVVKKRVQPRFPRGGAEHAPARCLGLVSIDENGEPFEVEVTECPEVFHRSTQKALMGWRWEPVINEGVALKAQALIAIEYAARGSEEQSAVRPPVLPPIGDAHVDVPFSTLRPTHWVAPEVPEQLVGEDCLVRLWVGAEGDVERVAVAGCGSQAEALVMGAVQQATFEPTTVGATIRAVSARFSFRLE